MEDEDSNLPMSFIDPIIKIVTFKPKSLLQALSEIGGLLIIFRISLLLVYAHEKFFDRELNKTNSQNFKELFTFDNFRNALLEIEQRKIKNDDYSHQIEQQSAKIE